MSALAELTVGQRYSNTEIMQALGVGNAGGIRACRSGDSMRRIVLMTTSGRFHSRSENPYNDHLTADVLTYTAAGKDGEQALSGVNQRLAEQRELGFPIHGFTLVASRRDKNAGECRWEYLGLLVHCGFRDVCLTPMSGHGGIDVSARAGERLWMFENALVQVQAKRWRHSVGRREVAELRGSLEPYAQGAVITTGHFTRAALNEAGAGGKKPILLVDGVRLAKIVLDEGISGY